MKKKDGFRMGSVCGATFLVAEGLDNIDFNQIIHLNETAVFLWEAMGDAQFTTDELVEKLTAEYEVTPAEAKDCIEQFLSKLQKAGVIEE